MCSARTSVAISSTLIPPVAKPPGGDGQHCLEQSRSSTCRKSTPHAHTPLGALRRRRNHDVAERRSLTIVLRFVGDCGRLIRCCRPDVLRQSNAGIAGLEEVQCYRIPAATSALWDEFADACSSWTDSKRNPARRIGNERDRAIAPTRGSRRPRLGAKRRRRVVPNVVDAVARLEPTRRQLAHASPRAATHGDDHNSLWHGSGTMWHRPISEHSSEVATALSWSFSGAGDENRTRVLSLGS